MFQEQAGTCHLCQQIFEGPSDSPAGLCLLPLWHGCFICRSESTSEGKGCTGSIKGLRGGLENQGIPIRQGQGLGCFTSTLSQGSWVPLPVMVLQICRTAALMLHAQGHSPAQTAAPWEQGAALGGQSSRGSGSSPASPSFHYN